MIKKLIYIFILIIISTNLTFAHPQQASVKYEGPSYAFKRGDEVKFLKNADVNMILFEKTQIQEEKDFYLQEAMRFYFLLEKYKSGSIDAQVGLGRIYDEMKLDKFAKEHFFTALNISPKNPKANYYFGNFYYKRNDLVESAFYYKRAYQYGLQNSFELNQRMGSVYEKLADLETAKNYYEKAFLLGARSPKLLEKIQILDNLNYSGSQYYLFNK